MMRALAVGLLLSSAPAEPHVLPVTATSVRVLEASARVIPDGSDTPDTHLTLLPEGVYFTREGYDRLVGVTTRLQEDLGSIRQRVREYEAVTLAPPPMTAPQLHEWSTSDVLLVGAICVVIGVVGGVVLVGMARSQ